jgi:diguanylate cyclase (GGDEF)-like protein
MHAIRASCPLLLCAAVWAAAPLAARGEVAPARPQLLAAPAAADQPLAATRPLDLADLGAPAFANFFARDGLPYSVVVAVATDSDGFAWAATPAGVFRYDGRRWEQSPDPAMAHSADALYVDARGTLWAGFRGAGLARYDGTHWHVENLATGLPSQQIRRFAETVDHAGARTLYALTWDRGLLVRRDGRWQADPGNGSLPHGALLSTAQTRTFGGRSRQWIGTGSSGLWYRDLGSRDWHRWHLDDIDSAQVEFMLATERGGHEELWLSVFGLGLVRLSDEGERRWTRAGGDLPSTEVYDIAATPLPGGDAAIWVASRAGQLRLHRERVQVFDRRHGLASDAIRGLDAWRSPDGRYVLWLATEAGVSRTIPGASAWTTASLMGAHSIGVFGVLVEPDGHGGERLWVGASDDGLAVYEDGAWRHYTFDAASPRGDGLAGPSVEMLVATTGADGRRTLWIGSGNGELSRVHPLAGGGYGFQRIPTPWTKSTGEGLRDTLVRSVDGREEQWVATRQAGLWRWRDGRWTAFRAAKATGQWGAGRLLEQIDAQGRSWLWANTNQGLARFDGERWDLFGRDDGLPDDVLIGLRLLPDAAGRPVLWMGSAAAGIIRVDISDPRRPRVLHGGLPPSPDPTAYGAQRVSRVRIYFCTSSGVQQLTPLAGGGWRSRVFARGDGLVHEVCNTNAQFLDAHDRFWTGTLGGLTVYDPSRLTNDTQPKPLRVTALRIDGAPQSGPALRVPAGAKSVEVDFALLSWTHEADSRFRTRLVGLDDAPGEWTAQASRNLGALTPGDYTLRIEARDYAGNLSKPLEIPITVEARWWQRPIAMLAAVLALVLAGYAIAAARTRMLRAQRRRLERHVARRTAELDAANARLTELSYRDPLTGLGNRRKLLDELDALAKECKAFGPGLTTALVFVDVDHFKDFNDRHGHLAGDVALRCVADNLLRCAPEGALVARHGGEEFACLLPRTDIAAAVVVAERMRRGMQAQAVPLPGPPVSGKPRSARITISAGVASADLAHADSDSLLQDADAALYRAKREGRNRVCFSNQ